MVSLGTEPFPLSIQRLLDKNDLCGLEETQIRVQQILRQAIRDQNTFLGGQKTLAMVQRELSNVERALRMVQEKMISMPQ